MKVNLIFDSEMWYVIPFPSKDTANSIANFTTYEAAEAACTKRKFTIESVEGLDD